MIEIYFSCFILALFFASLIFLKKGKESKDKVLMLFILLFGLESITIFSLYKGWHYKHPEIYYGDFAFWTLLGPLLFLYVKFTIDKNFKLKPVHLLHFLPMIIVFTSNWDFVYYIAQGNDSNQYLTYKNSYYTYIGTFVFEFSALLYNIWAIIKISKYRKKIPDYFSNTKNINLKWLYYFTYGFAFYLCLGALNLLINQLFNLKITENLFNYIGIISFFYIIGIGYFGYKQKGIFFDFQNDNNFNDFSPANNKYEYSFTIPYDKLVKVEPDKPRYIKSGLKADESKIMINQLKTYMEINKPYLDCEFNLKSLSEELNISQHNLSQILNEYLHTNFFDFVNKYRVEEVKKLLAKPEMNNYTLLSIAFDAGFNSKSTFYTAFKKITNQTPTEYRKNLQFVVELIS